MITFPGFQWFFGYGTKIKKKKLIKPYSAPDLIFRNRERFISVLIMSEKVSYPESYPQPSEDDEGEIC